MYVPCSPLLSAKCVLPLPTQKQTRAHSLVDMHKSSKGKDKDKDGDGPPGIWDHARDMSVGGRLMDDGQRSKMITEARGLGDRFGKGKSGGWL
jgi:hypothetical protein